MTLGLSPNTRGYSRTSTTWNLIDFRVFGFGLPSSIWRDELNTELRDVVDDVEALRCFLGNVMVLLTLFPTVILVADRTRRKEMRRIGIPMGCSFWDVPAP